MPRTRTEIDLPLVLDGDGPLHAQLSRALRATIRSGALPAGSALPASRTLAADLRVSRGVVVESYAQLRAEGFLTTTPRGTTKVSELTTEQVSELTSRHRIPARQEVSSDTSPRWDLRPGSPDLSLFPREAWSRALRGVLREAPDSAFGYGQDAGVEVLRSGLAAYLGRVRAVAAAPGQVVVTTGVAQGTGLVARVLRTRGARRIAVEDPGHREEAALLAAAGLEPVPVRVDDEGMTVPSVQVDAALLTPAHQYPSGVVLSPARRAALIAWAREHRAWLLEDDYDAEFRYDRAPVGSLQGMAPDVVVHLGSVSKVLAPGLRLGWLVAPGALVDDLLRAKRFADLGTPVLEQLAFARLLADGGHDRHLRRVRRAYRARRDLLAAQLPVRGAAAGLHVVVAVADERGAQEDLAARGIAVDTLAQFRVAPGPPGLVLGYGRESLPALTAAVREVAEVVAGRGGAGADA